MSKSLRSQILKAGFYPVEQSGDTMRITVPKRFTPPAEVTTEKPCPPGLFFFAGALVTLFAIEAGVIITLVLSLPGIFVLVRTYRRIYDRYEVVPYAERPGKRPFGR